MEQHYHSLHVGRSTSFVPQIKMNEEHRFTMAYKLRASESCSITYEPASTDTISCIITISYTAYCPHLSEDWCQYLLSTYYETLFWNDNEKTLQKSLVK